jgi:hypothetical protein
MEAAGHSGYTLSKALRTSEAVISNIRTGKNPPNIQLVRGLLNMYLDLDPDWLLHGRKAMRRSGKEGRSDSELVASNEAAVLASIDERLGRLEELLTRTMVSRLDRTVLEDESQADADERLDALEKKMKDVTKVPSKKSSSLQ